MGFDSRRNKFSIPCECSRKHFFSQLDTTLGSQVNNFPLCPLQEKVRLFSGNRRIRRLSGHPRPIFQLDHLPSHSWSQSQSWQEGQLQIFRVWTSPIRHSPLFGRQQSKSIRLISKVLLESREKTASILSTSGFESNEFLTWFLFSISSNQKGIKSRWYCDEWRSFSGCESWIGIVHSV